MPLHWKRELICMVTDRWRLSPGADAVQADRLVELVRSAGRAGVDLIQIRERDLEAGALTQLARRCVAAVAGTHTAIVVNDRADVVLASGAHGVHLRSDSVDGPSARRLLPPGAIIGRSVHSAGEAAAATHAGGLDYVVLGTMFATASKGSTHRLTPMGELSETVAATSTPILAIGGITLDLAETVARTGVAGVAAVGLFIPPAGADPDRHLRGAVSGLRRAFDTCRALP